MANAKESSAQRQSIALVTSSKDPRIQASTTSSILATSTASPQRTRFDAQGNAITKGVNKKHKITFNNNVNQVHEVESYKEYNADENVEQKKCCIIQQLRFNLLTLVDTIAAS
eukprot:TRINITY_DN7305_c0_g1_i7.p1 TRINITY_DN7305_c0_g1~~TRINITY_DN7305_c0_g1_i7.p1  ORF type:complete len:113 (-),score=16.42 TRINITY_DN7305_c0_g1_i7:400-738(-)